MSCKCACSISSFLRYFSTPSKKLYTRSNYTNLYMLRSFAYFSHAWRWLFFRVCVQMRLKLCIDGETFSVWVMNSVHSLYAMIPDLDGSSLLQSHVHSLFFKKRLCRTFTLFLLNFVWHTWARQLFSLFSGAGNRHTY